MAGPSNGLCRELPGAITNRLGVLRPDLNRTKAFDGPAIASENPTVAAARSSAVRAASIITEFAGQDMSVAWAFSSTATALTFLKQYLLRPCSWRYPVGRFAIATHCHVVTTKRLDHANLTRRPAWCWDPGNFFRLGATTEIHAGTLVVGVLIPQRRVVCVCH